MFQKLLRFFKSPAKHYQMWGYSLTAFLLSSPALFIPEIAQAAMDETKKRILLRAVGDILKFSVSPLLGGISIYHNSRANFQDLKGDLPAVVLKPLLDLVWGSIAAFFSWLSGIWAGIINATIGPLMHDVFYVGIIKELWDIALGVANATFFLALLVFSLLIIFRYSGYNFKKAVTSLVFVAFLANISYQVSYIIIFDIGGALTSVASDMFGTGINDIGTWIQTELGAIFGAFKPGDLGFQEYADKFGDTQYVDLLAPIANGIVAIVLSFVLFKLAWVMIERTIRLAYLTFVAPVIFALSLFPAKSLQGLAAQWWEDIFKWTLVLPLALFLVSAAMKFFEVANFGNVTLAEALVGAPTSEPTIWINIIFLILCISFIIVAGNAPKMAGTALSSITENGGQWLQNVTKQKLYDEPINKIKQGAGWAGKEIRGAVGAKAADIGYRTGITRPLLEYQAKAKARREGQEKAREQAIANTVNADVLRRGTRDVARYNAQVDGEIQLVLNRDSLDTSTGTPAEQAAKMALQNELNSANTDMDKVKRLANAAGLDYDRVKSTAEENANNSTVGFNKAESQAQLVGAMNKLIGGAYDQDQTPENMEKKFDDAVAILNDPNASAKEKEKAALDTNTWWGVIDKTSRKHPNKEIREQAQAIAQKIGTSEAALPKAERVLTRTGFPFGGAPAPKALEDPSSFNRVTDADLRDLANGKASLETDQNEQQQAKRDAQAAGNTDMTIALNILDGLNAEEADKLVSSAIGLGSDQANKKVVDALKTLSDNGTLATIEENLNTTDQTNIEAIRNDSTKNAVQKTDAINDYIKNRLISKKAIDPTDAASLDQIKNAAELISQNQSIDVRQLSQTQKAAQVASTASGQTTLKEYADRKTSIDVGIQEVTKIEAKVNQETKATPGYREEVRKQKESATLTDARMREINKLEDQLDALFASRAGSASSTNILSYANPLKRQIFDAMQDGSPSILINGKPINSEQDVATLSHRDAKEWFRKLNNTYHNPQE